MNAEAEGRQNVRHRDGAFQRLDVASGQTQVDSKQHLGQWSAAAEEQIGRLQRRSLFSHRRFAGAAGG